MLPGSYQCYVNCGKDCRNCNDKSSGIILLQTYCCAESWIQYGEEKRDLPDVVNHALMLVMGVLLLILQHFPECVNLVVILVLQPPKLLLGL